MAELQRSEQQMQDLKLLPLVQPGSPPLTSQELITVLLPKPFDKIIKKVFQYILWYFFDFSHLSMHVVVVESFFGGNL